MGNISELEWWIISYLLTVPVFERYGGASAEGQNLIGTNKSLSGVVTHL